MANMRLGKEACAARAGMGPGNSVGLIVRESQSSSGRHGQCMRPQAVARQHSWSSLTSGATDMTSRIASR
jgi:hypothetical protein